MPIARWPGARARISRLYLCNNVSYHALARKWYSRDTGYHNVHCATRVAQGRKLWKMDSGVQVDDIFDPSVRRGGHCSSSLVLVTWPEVLLTPTVFVFSRRGVRPVTGLIECFIIDEMGWIRDARWPKNEVTCLQVNLVLSIPSGKKHFEIRCVIRMWEWIACVYLLVGRISK